MRTWEVVVLFVAFSLFCRDSSAAKPRAKARVFWCDSIPTQREWQEAQFNVIYRFDVSDDGKPINIRRLLDAPFQIDDKPFGECISQWQMPFVRRRGTAQFFWKWYWRDLQVYSKGFRKLVPYKPGTTRGNLVQNHS